MAIPTVASPRRHELPGSNKMTDLPGINDHNNNNVIVPEIPFEIVSEEEMALIDAAMVAATATTRSCLSSSLIPSIPSPSRSSQFPINVRSIQSITLLSKRKISCCTEPDMEDSGNFMSTQKRNRVAESLLSRFRKKRGLSVTDITATEWCGKQMEFTLLYGKRKTTAAMKAGWFRHTMLEEEVVKKVEVQVKSVEDRWALKLLNFISGVNQLLFDGLTRELPLIGFVNGVWMVGVIDEIRMPGTGADRNPMLADTKTRVQDTLPGEPQRRNGRLQLMCYKYLWDYLASNSFPSKKFFDCFSLNPLSILSEDIRENTASSGLHAKTLDDVVRYFTNTCSMLPLSHSQLLLRYESQKDQSLLGEDQFVYDYDYVKNELQDSFEFWRGEREARYTPEEERWKCRFCQFSSICPTNINSDSTSNSPNPQKS